MKDHRLGGIALIVCAVGGILVMSVHPTGRDLLAPGQFAPMALLGRTVHALAIVLMPISFLGALALSRRLDAPDRLAVAALVVYGFALAASISAAAVSGFVAPDLGRQILSTTPPESDGWRLVFSYTGYLNQGFSRIFAVASSTAIVLWSVCIVKNRALARGVGIYGLLAGPAVILAVGSGYLRLNVHGFGLVILVQAVWFVIAGALLYRREEERPVPAAAPAG